MTTIDTSDVTSLRRFNTRTTLDVLKSEPTTWFTVRELSDLTALSRPTVARVLDDLAAAGWATSVAGQPGETGRPARRFTFNHRRGLVLSFVETPSYFMVAAADLAGEVLATVSREDLTIRGQADILPVLRDLADEVRQAAGPELPVLSVSAALPGAVDKEGVIVASIYAPEWIGLELRSPLSTLFPGAALHLSRSVELATTAELSSGSLHGVDSAVHLLFSDRSAATLVVDGAIVRGAHALAGARPQPHGGEDGMVPDWPTLRQQLYADHDEQTLPEMIEAAKRGEETYLRSLARYTEDLAPRLAFLTRVIDPEVVLISGEMLALPDIALPPLERAVRAALGEDVEIRTAHHPFVRAAIVGGIHEALSAIDWVD